MNPATRSSSTVFARCAASAARVRLLLSRFSERCVTNPICADTRLSRDLYAHRMGLDSIVRWFLPKEDHFYDFLEQQADVAHEAAIALAQFRNAGTPSTPPYRTPEGTEQPIRAEQIRDTVQDLEHKGDAIVHQMEEALAKTFVTPIDREDIQKLSSELDDIIDLANGAARAYVLFGVEKPTEPMIALMDLLVECTKVLRVAMPNLRQAKYEALIEASRTLRKLEKEGDVIFRDAVGHLFRDSNIDAKKLIREREVLEDLEKSIDHCEHVSTTLAYLSVKHS
jgi:uncharacterized protein